MNTPLVPSSSAAPEKALLTQWATNMPRTPRRLYMASPRLMSARLHPGLPSRLAAPEQVRRFDPDHHRQLAGAHHLSRLGRAIDEAEPALAGAATLGVDVVLQALERADLGEDRGRLRARPRAPSRLEPAQRLVVGGLGHDHPHAGAPRPLAATRSRPAGGSSSYTSATP